MATKKKTPVSPAAASSPAAGTQEAKGAAAPNLGWIKKAFKLPDALVARMADACDVRDIDPSEEDAGEGSDAQGIVVAPREEGAPWQLRLYTMSEGRGEGHRFVAICDEKGNELFCRSDDGDGDWTDTDPDLDADADPPLYALLRGHELGGAQLDTEEVHRLIGLMVDTLSRRLRRPSETEGPIVSRIQKSFGIRDETMRMLVERFEVNEPDEAPNALFASVGEEPELTLVLFGGRRHGAESHPRGIEVMISEGSDVGHILAFHEHKPGTWTPDPCEKKHAGIDKVLKDGGFKKGNLDMNEALRLIDALVAELPKIA